MPEQGVVCPHCGGQALLVLELGSNLPRLRFGLPLYHCQQRECEREFTGADIEKEKRSAR